MRQQYNALEQKDGSTQVLWMVNAFMFWSYSLPNGFTLKL